MLSQQFPTSFTDSSSSSLIVGAAAVVVTCFLLWLLPVLCLKLIVHKKQPLGTVRKRVQRIAHRGSRCEGLPENTIAAFKDAVSAGADAVELDVWLTADAQVAVHHDQTLQRMTQQQHGERITDLNFDELPQLVPSRQQNERLSEFKREECLCIPRLVDVLVAVPASVAVIIEFKQDSDVLIAAVARIVQQQGRSQTVFWFSLEEKINEKLRVAAATAGGCKVPTITSIPAMLKTLALYYTGLLPFMQIEDAVFGITVEEITLQKIREEKALKPVPDIVKRLLSFIFAGKPPMAMVAPRLFAHLRQRGIHVWFLGVNTDADLQLAVASGATAVLTDRPRWLSSTMKEQNLSFQSLQE